MHEPPGRTDFATTHWSMVLAAGSDEASTTRARAALEELCRTYWAPLYAYVRHRGYGDDDARDLTQAFFTRVLETRGLASADPARGRFRSYLLGAMKHFLANEWHRSRAHKRGGDVRFLDWDALDPEIPTIDGAVSAEDPELRFDRAWAFATVAGALRALRDEMTEAGKSEQFEALRGSLGGDAALPREEIAERLGMSPGAVKVAVHRLRKRYRELLRDTVAATVGSRADLDEEMRYLVSILRAR